MAVLSYTEIDTLLQTSNFQSVHNCKFCPYISKSIFFMRNHAKLHLSHKKLFNCSESSPEPYYCVDCDFGTDTLKLLSQHIRQFHHSKPEIGDYSLTSLICRHCEFETYSRLHWLRHYKTDCVGTEPEETSSEVEDVELRAHVKRKHPTEFESESITNHKDSHDGQKHQFNFCDFKSKYSLEFEKFVSRLHTDLDRLKWLECKKCEYKTKITQNFRNHKRKHNLTLRHKCTKCDYKTKDRGQLKSHELAKHTPLENIDWQKCDQCSYKGKTSKRLKVHMIMKHSNPDSIKWHECEYCIFRSKTKANFNLHMLRKHTDPKDIKWFACDHCHYKGKTLDALQRHLTTTTKHLKKKNDDD